MSKYHKTEGGLWPNDEKSKPSHPDMKGRVEVSKEQMKGLIAMHKEGKTPKIQLASWHRKAKDTDRSISMLLARYFGMQRRRPLHPPPPQA